MIVRRTLFHSRSKQVASAFAALRALDASASERKELTAAGTPQHTIDALYPEVGFAAIVPALGEHLSRIPPAKLADLRTEWQRPLDALMKVVPNRVWEIINRGLAFDEMADAVERSKLAAHVYVLLQGQDRLRIDDMRDWVAESIVTSCWWAWWVAEHQSELPAQMVVPAKNLTLAVAKTLKLTQRRSAP